VENRVGEEINARLWGAQYFPWRGFFVGYREPFDMLFFGLSGALAELLEQGRRQFSVISWMSILGKFSKIFSGCWAVLFYGLRLCIARLVQTYCNPSVLPLLKTYVFDFRSWLLQSGLSTEGGFMRIAD